MSQGIDEKPNIRPGSTQQHALAFGRHGEPHDTLLGVVARATDELTLDERIDVLRR